LDESLHLNLRMGYFEAGHMMYIHLPSLEKLKGELADFINGPLERIDPQKAVNRIQRLLQAWLTWE